MKLKKIKDQVVVVAGATSGIGRETALQFAKKGARVVAAGRSMEAPESLVAEIRDRQGEAIAVEADVSQYDQMQKLADQAVRTYGRIDTWVHAAAVTMYARFEETKDTPFFDKALTRLGVKPAPLPPI